MSATARRARCPPELATALQTGLVDGQDNGIFDVVAAGYAEVQDYFSPIDYLYSGMGLWMSGRKWASLTPQQQGWARQAADAAYADALKVYDRRLQDAFDAAEAKGVEIVEPDIPAFRAASRPVVEGLDGKAWPAGLYDRIHGLE
jgi:TRAP-type C4-dicarboxylate transport system substrate-binding protein